MSPVSKVHGANLGPIWSRQDPGTVFTKGLKSRVLSLDLSHELGEDSRRIH